MKNDLIYDVNTVPNHNINHLCIVDMVNVLTSISKSKRQY